MRGKHEIDSKWKRNCLSDNLNVSKLLVEQKVKMPEMVSVELNGEILDRRLLQPPGLKMVIRWNSCILWEAASEPK